MLKPKSLFFCLCAPAASGKTTIASEIINHEVEVRRSISTTTRPPREGEQDGIDYFFVSREEFKRRLDLGQFIEHAKFNDNYYGTELLNMRYADLHNKDLLLTIEVKGVKQLKEMYFDKVVTIFLIPPSLEELKSRLVGRGTDSKESITARLNEAQKELEILSSPNFSDYLVVNDKIGQSVEKVKSIIQAERVKYKNLHGVEDFLKLKFR